MMPPPSMTVSMFVGTAIVEEIAMVAAPPQSNVTTPPAWTAVSSAASVQLPASPVPTTVVGVDVFERGTAKEQVAAGSAPSDDPMLPSKSAVDPPSEIDDPPDEEPPDDDDDPPDDEPPDDDDSLAPSAPDAFPPSPPAPPLDDDAPQAQANPNAPHDSARRTEAEAAGRRRERSLCIVYPAINSLTRASRGPPESTPLASVRNT